MAITLEDITTLQLDGTGSFDTLMQAVRLHVADAKKKNEITQEQAGNIYVNVIPGIIAEAVKYELQKDIVAQQVNQEMYKTDIAAKELAIKEEELKQAQSQAAVKGIEQAIATDPLYKDAKVDEVVTTTDILKKNYEKAQKEVDLYIEKLIAEKEKNGGVTWEYRYKKYYNDYKGTTHIQPWAYRSGTDTDGNTVYGLWKEEDSKEYIGTTEIEAGSSVELPILPKTTETLYGYTTSNGEFVQQDAYDDTGTASIIDSAVVYLSESGTYEFTSVPLRIYDADNKTFSTSTIKNEVYMGKGYLLMYQDRYVLANPTVDTIEKQGTDGDWWDDLLANLSTPGDVADCYARWLDDPNTDEFGGTDDAEGTGKVTLFVNAVLLAGDTNTKTYDVAVNEAYTKDYTYEYEWYHELDSKIVTDTPAESMLKVQMDEIKSKTNLYDRQIKGFDETRADRLLKMGIDVQTVYMNANGNGGTGFAMNQLEHGDNKDYNIYRALFDEALQFKKGKAENKGIVTIK